MMLTIKNNSSMILVLLLGALWYGWVFTQYSPDTSIRSDGTIKYKKIVDWTEYRDFYYHYQYRELDPERRGISSILSGSAPHRATYKGHEVITYPEFFTILGAVWQSVTSPHWLFLVPVFLGMLELAGFVFLARNIIGLTHTMSFLGGAILLFGTPQFLFNLQLQEVVLASSLTLWSISLLSLSRNRRSSLLAMVAGLLLAMAFFNRQEVIFAGFICCVAILIVSELDDDFGFELNLGRIWKRHGLVLTYGLTFLGGFVLYLVYNQVYFGAPLGVRYYAVLDAGSGFAHRWHIFSSLIFGSFDSRAPVLGLLAQLPLLVLLPILYFYVRTELRGPIRWIVPSSMVGTLLICLASPNDSWGGTWGPRFTMVVHGILIVSLVAVLEKAWFRFRRNRSRILLLGAGVVLLIGTLAVTVIGWKLEKFTISYVEELQNDIHQLHGAPILAVSDIYYYAGLTILDSPMLEVKGGKTMASDVDYFLNRAKIMDAGDFVVFHSDFFSEKEKSKYSMFESILEKKGFVLKPISETSPGHVRFLKLQASPNANVSRAL
ncbi:MAG: hypothetical protein KDK37_01830 [Leptospiraceae bacterium]|nr:hypothetical protein [Leptospiraceae bacterium]